MKKYLDYLPIVFFLLSIGAFTYFKVIYPKIPKFSIACTVFEDKVVKKEVAGDDCIFGENDNYASLSLEDESLNIFENKIKISTVNHIKQIFSKDNEGNILALRHDFETIKNIPHVKFDKILKINKLGQIINSFSFYDHFSELIMTTKVDVDPYKLFPENSPYSYTISEVASVDQVPTDLYLDGKLIIPQGSFAIWSNVGFRNLIFLDQDLKKVLYTLDLKKVMLNDVQITPLGNILYFENSTRIINKNQKTQKNQRLNWWAKIGEVDFHTNRRHLSFYPKLFGELGGGVREIGLGLYLIMDYKEFKVEVETTFFNVDKLNKRIILYSKFFGILDSFNVHLNDGKMRIIKNNL